MGTDGVGDNFNPYVTNQLGLPLLPSLLSVWINIVDGDIWILTLYHRSIVKIIYTSNNCVGASFSRKSALRSLICGNQKTMNRPGKVDSILPSLTLWTQTKLSFFQVVTTYVPTSNQTLCCTKFTVLVSTTIRPETRATWKKYPFTSKNCNMFHVFRCTKFNFSMR